MYFRLISLILICSSNVWAGEKVIFCLGDSLTAGYHIPSKSAWPNLVEEGLKSEKNSVKVINGGVSGSTTASGMGRLNWHMKAKGAPDILVLALGANDGLRGQKTESMKSNLSSIIQKAKKAGSHVLLAGMKMPPNYGKDYTNRFEKVFTDLAKEEDVSLIPFLLEGVAAVPKLNLPDGIHPNEDGHRVMADLVLKHLKPILQP